MGISNMDFESSSTSAADGQSGIFAMLLIPVCPFRLSEVLKGGKNGLSFSTPIYTNHICHYRNIFEEKS